MSPRTIAARARQCGLDLIAVCDHNSADNVVSVRKAAGLVGVGVFGGMEITTKEEVHILALFDACSDDRLMDLQSVVYRSLHQAGLWKDVKRQVIANENDEVVGFNTRPLVSATRLSLEQTIDLIHSLGGLAVASHIDRQGFGLLGQLGFIPAGLPLDGVEISPRMRCDEARGMFDVPYPFVTASDAHRPEDIGAAYVRLEGMRALAVRDLKACLSSSSSVRCERAADQ